MFVPRNKHVEIWYYAMTYECLLVVIVEYKALIAARGAAVPIPYTVAYARTLDYVVGGGRTDNTHETDETDKTDKTDKIDNKQKKTNKTNKTKQ